MITTTKKNLHLLCSKIIRLDNSLVIGTIVFLVFVVIGLINLNFRQPLWIDVEASDYGNVGTAILDGNILQAFSIHFGYIPREGSNLILSPLVALFFFLFGENYYNLQKIGILLMGFWPVVWFLVACQLFKKEKIIWLAFLFIIATPLIHLQKSPIVFLFTHVGVSILFGLSLLLLLKSQDLKNNKKKGFLFISGLIYSIAFFYGPVSLLFMPMILILFLKRGLRFSSFLCWIFGFFTIFVFYFQYYDWSFLKEVTQSRIYIDEQTNLSVFASLLVYFGGILKNDALSITRIGNSGGSYSLLSAFYLVFLLVVSSYHLAIRFPKEKGGLLRVKNISIEAVAFFTGSIIFLAAVANFRYALVFDWFHGLRYLIPLIPFYLLTLSYFLIKNCHKVFIRGSFLIYIGFTIFILFSFVYPFQESNKKAYGQISGFNAGYLLTSPELAIKINLENAADDRLGRYAFMMGGAYTKLPDNFSIKKQEIAKQLAIKPANVREHTLDEFVRGYYFQKGLSLDSCETIQRFFKENSYALEPLAIQGLGMGIAKKCAGRSNININPESKCLKDVYSLSDKETLKNLGWGYGRHFYHAGSPDIFDAPGLYEGILEGKEWAQKYYHPLDHFYPWLMPIFYNLES